MRHLMFAAAAVVLLGATGCASDNERAEAAFVENARAAAYAERFTDAELVEMGRELCEAGHQGRGSLADLGASSAEYARESGESVQLAEHIATVHAAAGAHLCPAS